MSIKEAATPKEAVDPSSLFINRELSWLEFNQRVLDQAFDESHPLLERVKFLSIVGSNLDEFFMVRVATLLRKRRASISTLSADGMTVEEQLAGVRRRAAAMMRDQAACWNERLRPALAVAGVRLVEPADYSAATERYLTSYFRTEIYPLLTPLAFDPGHPFPLISNRSKNFAVVVRHKHRTKFARVKVPALLPRFVPVPDPAGASVHAFVFLEDVIRLNLRELFCGVDLSGAHLFRVIRDSDMVVPDAAEDLLESVDRTLKELRHAAPSFLEAETSMPQRVLKIIVENFAVDDDIVVHTPHRLDFSDWMALTRVSLPQLKDATYTPRTLWPVSGTRSLFDEIRDQDFLVHHPFDSFSAVEAFVERAATDPQVAAIKMTLYRIGANSPLIDMLIDAADDGKQVTVLVELKARFDERNNIKWAERLEEAGVHVVYGVENLKTHCKLCFVVRREGDGITRYAHIGTGNYNRATSQVYTDLGLFTANPRVMDDVTEVFNYLTGYSNRAEYSELLVAPVSLRERFLDLLARETEHARAGRPARVIVKCNAVTDPTVVRALYLASQHGVTIDMIIRGVCVLRPGVAGMSERIRVRSIVGRFLEHSRIYSFENGGNPEVFIGSADLMDRNLDRRVETLCRVSDPDIVSHLRDVVLNAYIRDNVRAYALTNDQYRRLEPPHGAAAVDAQRLLMDWYRSSVRCRPDGEPFGGLVRID